MTFNAACTMMGIHRRTLAAATAFVSLMMVNEAEFASVLGHEAGHVAAEGIHVTFASGLLFDFDSDAILPAAAVTLRSLAASLKKYCDTDLLMVGHTDSSGTPEYNQSLSTRRSNSAAGYLALQGVSANRMRTSGMGEMEPLATNETEAGRQANLRIEVAIFATTAARAGGQPQADHPVRR